MPNPPKPINGKSYSIQYPTTFTHIYQASVINTVTAETQCFYGASSEEAFDKATAFADEYVTSSMECHGSVPGYMIEVHTVTLPKKTAEAVIEKVPSGFIQIWDYKHGRTIEIPEWMTAGNLIAFLRMHNLEIQYRSK